MVSNGKSSTIAAALAAAISLNAVSAGADVPQSGQAYAQNDTNVVRMVPVNASVATCPSSADVQIGFKPNPKTNSEFVEIVLAPMFEKQCKNAIILFSDKPPEENDAFIRQLAGEVGKLKSDYQRRGLNMKIDYIMQVYRGGNYKNINGVQISPPDEGSMRVYLGSFPLSEHPTTKKPIRSVNDLMHTLEVAAVGMNDKDALEKATREKFDRERQEIERRRKILKEVDGLTEKKASSSDGGSTTTSASGMPDLPDPFA